MPGPTDPAEHVTERCLAALALGLSASWMEPEQQVAELRAAGDVTAATAAREALGAMARTDPVASGRAIRLIDAAFPAAGPAMEPAG